MNNQYTYECISIPIQSLAIRVTLSTFIGLDLPNIKFIHCPDSVLHHPGLPWWAEGLIPSSSWEFVIWHHSAVNSFGNCYGRRDPLYPRSNSLPGAACIQNWLMQERVKGFMPSPQFATTQKGNPAVELLGGSAEAVSFLSVLLTYLPHYCCWSWEHPLTNFLNANLHPGICFPMTTTYLTYGTSRHCANYRLHTWRMVKEISQEHKDDSTSKFC